jgi:hypothetical protein
MGAGSLTKQAKMVNIGKLVLQGMSMAQAMQQSGYAAATARQPKNNGLVAAQCIQAALEAESGVQAATLKKEARGVLVDKLRWSAANIEKIRLSDAVRAVEGTELLSDDGPADISPRAFGERLAWLEQAQAAYKQRTGRTVGMGGGSPEKQAALPAVDNESAAVTVIDSDSASDAACPADPTGTGRDERAG